MALSLLVANGPCNQKIIRRSANYQPPIWDYDYVQSLNSKYVGDVYEKRAAKLKEDVKIMLEKVADEDPLDALEMVDDVQRLGVFYHFKDEIERVLERIYKMNDKCNNEDLHATALKFRLLRQHGYNVPQDVFKKFMDEMGNLRSYLCEDTKGLLYLYEASYLSIDGESLLDEARDFTTRNLKENLKKRDIDQNLAMLVRHSLELPLHWRVLRLEARWFIDVYERRQDMNSILLELAKLDFNMVQAIHQQEVKQISRWWRSTCLGKKLSFARDRLMENFLGTLGVNFEPQFGYFRRMSTKVYTLITIIDDIYDVYGSLEELELFTNAVERWDISAMEQLPDYMKICFLALFNSINEMAYDALKEQGLHIILHLKKVDLCKSYLLEAKWYYNGYTPTFEEYMKNAWISVSGPVMLVHAYCFDSKSVTKEASECLLDSYPNIIRWSSIIIRLSDDLGTSSDELQRGDVPKSIQCYMHETGASENDAREHMKYLIGETWKKMNEDGAANSLFTKTFIGNAMNLARMLQYLYQHGDGYGAPGKETKYHVLSSVVNPVPLIGMVLLTMSVSIKFWKPTCTNGVCKASSSQTAFFYSALYIIAVGSGGTKPNISTFGADQFDDINPHEKKLKVSFFNWWTFSSFIGGLVATLGLVYIQENLGWGLGLGRQSPGEDMVRVIVNAFANRRVKVPSQPSELHEFGLQHYINCRKRKVHHTPNFRNGDDDSVAKMKAAEDALQEKEKGKNLHSSSLGSSLRKLTESEVII
ncbi:unnamed protein product [Camellia sinensis]